MKKAISLVLVLSLFVCGNSIFASAQNDTESTETPVASVEYLPIGSDSAVPEWVSVGVTDTGVGDKLRNTTVVNLGTNGSANINWSVNGKSTIRSTYNYTTASGSIILRVTGSSTTSIMFQLYDSTDKLIAEQTAQVSSTIVTTVRFTSLITSKQYYIKATNLSNVATTMTGTIAAV